jgi:ABC-type dipeptide/oligopeptide/nickel transport system permease subunit
MIVHNAIWTFVVAIGLVIFMLAILALLGYGIEPVGAP